MSHILARALVAATALPQNSAEAIFAQAAPSIDLVGGLMSQGPGFVMAAIFLGLYFRERKNNEKLTEKLIELSAAQAQGTAGMSGVLRDGKEQARANCDLIDRTNRLSKATLMHIKEVRVSMGHKISRTTDEGDDGL